MDSPPSTPGSAAPAGDPAPRGASTAAGRGPFGEGDERMLEATDQSGIQALLTMDPRFKWAIAVFAGLMLLLTGLLPKIWRVTPARLPSVRVSGMDYLEAKALGRTAAQQAAAGDLQGSLQSWEAALANNPADQAALRGALRTVLAQPGAARKLSGRVFRTAGLLMELAGTNPADMNLAVAALSKAGRDEFASALAAGAESSLDPAAYAGLTAGAFRLGRIPRFEELWSARAAELARDSEAALHRAAWEAGWGPADTRRHGLQTLEGAIGGGDENLAETARRLSLRVALLEQDLAGYQHHLDWLQERHADEIEEHVNLWRLMAAAGRRAEAQKLAGAFSTPPQGPEQLVGLATAFARLDLAPMAIQRLEAERNRFSFSPLVWTALARLQTAEKRWVDLRATALAMRSEPNLQTQLDGYSLFLTGLVDHHLHRATAAEQEFQAASKSRWGDPGLAFESAETLNREGYPAIAQELLRRVEGQFSSRYEFWFALTASAYETQDMKTLSEAVRRAYALAPASKEIANNYAAALLALRENPEQAIQVTMRLHADHPKDRRFAQNHAMALLQNGRTEEAAALLRSWNPDELPAMEAATVLYGWAEYFLKSGDAARARSNYVRINRAFLLPPQREWFEAEAAKVVPGR